MKPKQLIAISGAAVAMAALFGLWFLTRGSSGASRGAADRDDPATSSQVTATKRHSGSAEPGTRAEAARPEDDGRPRTTEPIVDTPYPHLDPAIKNNTAAAVPLKLGDRALRAGDFVVALERAEEVLRIDATNNRARVVATLAACGQSEARIAQRHANLLDPMRYERVRRRCEAEYGVTLTPDSRELTADQKQAANPDEGPQPPPPGEYRKSK
jgi:hypothetical protein